MIQGARPYNAPFTAFKMSICQPPPEGPKFVPMQFEFSDTTAWLVDLNNGGPQGALLSQCSCLYVDASQSMHDINILFPDSGYQVRVGQGDGQMVPVLTSGNVPPRFYVVLDSSNQTSDTDTCNVFALNQFVPEFVTGNTVSFQNAVSYGYSSLFQLKPNFTVSNLFPGGVGSSIMNSRIINAQQYFMTGFVISGEGASTSGSGRYIISLNDGLDINSIFSTTIYLPPGGINIPPIAINGLNFESLINDTDNMGLWMTVGSSAGMDSGTAISVMVAGGILIP